MKEISAVLLLLFGHLTAFALDPNREITQYVRNLWDSDSGLQGEMFAIHQTRDGYLWVGTSNGLARFDGVHFEIFDSVRVPEITAPEIFCLLESPDGTLWIGSYWGGLLSFKDGHFQKYGKAQGLQDERVVSIEQDHEGALWLGTPNGLFRMKNQKFTRYWTENGLSGRVVWAMVEDHAGKLWIATVGGGLYYYQNGKFSRYTGIPADGDILSLLEDHNHNLWVGSGEGLFRIQNEKVTVFQKKDGLSSGCVKALAEDHDGNIWIGELTGLTRFHNGEIRTMKKENGLAYAVRSLYEDREQTLWVGTQGGGLLSLRDGKVIAFSQEEGLAGDSVASVHANSQDDVWVGTNTGLSLIQKTARGYSVQSIPTETTVRSILEDSSKNVWVGLELKGIYLLRKKELQPFLDNKKLLSSIPWAIYEESPHTIWLGFFGNGINRITNGLLDGSFTMKDGLPTSYVQAFISDADGLLIATEDAGILRFKDGKFSTYISQDVLENQVFTLYYDDEKVLWMGALGGGLKRFKNGKLKTIRRANGLMDDSIGNILEDRNGNLWIDSQKGIFSVPKKQLNDFADGAISHVECFVLGKSDGMKAVESTAGMQPAAWKTHDGKLWFATAKGVVVIDPDHLPKNSVIPPVHIEQLIVDGRVLDRNSVDNAQLKAGSEKIEFHYTSLSLADPARVQFKYKLEGYDANWVDAGTRRVAYYTHIPPGKYHFRVIACNNDHVWNETGEAAAFYMTPHFYQTIWFYSLCAFSVFGVAVGLHRQKMRKANTEFVAVLSERARIARDIHDGLTQALAGVVMQLETVRLLPAGEDAQRHLDRALTLARKSVEDARRTIGDLRPQPFSAPDFPEGVRSLVQYQIQDSRLTFVFQVVGNPVTLSARVQPEILGICQEAVQNAVKHSRAANLIVELHFEHACFRMVVQDDGCGFDAGQASQPGHFGRQGMLERTKQMNAKILIESKPNYGTRIELIVPKEM